MYLFHNPSTLYFPPMLYISLVHKQYMKFALVKVDVLRGGINYSDFVQYYFALFQLGNSNMLSFHWMEHIVLLDTEYKMFVPQMLEKYHVHTNHSYFVRNQFGNSQLGNQYN